MSCSNLQQRRGRIGLGKNDAAARSPKGLVRGRSDHVCVRDRDDFPTPLEVSGEDDVHVGRIRLDNSVENGLALFLVGDNLRRGTALNAVDIFRTWALGPEVPT